MTALLRYDAACHAIAEAKTVDEVTTWIDKAAAVREYGRRIKNRQLEIDAIEIRVKAKRRRGELLLQLHAEGRLRDGRAPKERSPEDDRLSLDDLGITKNESSEEQTIAKIDGNSFDRLVARCRAYTEANPKLHSFNILKPPPENGPIHGGRSIMGSRVEPDDSLDYFPTPPWATRALIERVLPEPPANFRAPSICTAWEPACGEGHIAEVLREYFKTVHASDIHDYGYAPLTSDFLAEAPAGAGGWVGTADWIITNPPFLDKAEAFTLRALELACVGVAMFVRQQWLEGGARYETIFRPHPPALIGQFSERVPLCKGRWDPKGSTATSYVWIVWLKKYGGPTQFFWIPPDCKAVLSKPDDVDRFTANPVIRKEQFDSSTGEVAPDPVTDPSTPNRENALTLAAPAAMPDPIDPNDPDNTGIPVFLRKPVPVQSRVASPLDETRGGG